MSVFKRLATITKANVNKVLDAMEGDGEAVMEQTIVDAKVELAAQKRAVAEVVADCDRYQAEYEKNLKEAEKYHGYAKKALSAGNEENAAKNLSLEKKYKAEAEETKVKLDKARAQEKIARDNLAKVTKQIKEAEDTMRDVKRTNRTAKSVEVATKGVVSESALERFDKLADKAQSRYDVAMAMNELEETPTTDEEEMERLYGSSSDEVSDEMAALRKEMGL